MVVLAGVMILRSPFDMGVGEHPHLLEQLHGSIDGRCVYSGFPGMHSTGDVGGHDVTSRTHDLKNDGATLLGHAVPAPSEELEDVVRLGSPISGQVRSGVVAIAGRLIIS